MAVVSMSEALRERTGSGRVLRPVGVEGAAERFMSGLMTGQRTRDDYTALVAQNYFVYRALEAAAERRSADPVARSFMSPALTRLPAIGADLRYLIGDDWQQQIEPLPTTAAYVDRIETVAAASTGGFVAHHYTRYLGDLSGCQVIRYVLQQQFGFETNGVGFWLFAGIAKPKEFKGVYRAQLDAVGWSVDERERVIAEVGVAYELTEALFAELAAVRARSVA